MSIVAKTAEPGSDTYQPLQMLVRWTGTFTDSGVDAALRIAAGRPKKGR